ncbi:putative adhesin [Rhodanobacter soli]|nr:hypothetical protein [Rhodanobacter denitrificans]
MPAGRTSILNDKLYLYTKNNGAKNGDHVVIDSHGFKSPHQRDHFVIPLNNAGNPISIHFYTPGGKAVVSGSTTAIYNNGTQLRWENVVKQVVRNEVVSSKTYVSGTNCTNYGLAKINPSDDTSWAGSVSNFIGERNNADSNDLIGLLNRSHPARDLVTVRNRRFTGYVTFEEVVTALAAMDYTDIHCTFCRSRLLVPEFMYPGHARHF